MLKHAFSMRSALIACLALLLVWGVFHQLTTTHRAKASSTTAHWLYVVEDGTVFVYDIDNNHALVKQFAIPEMGKRGVAVSPSRGMLYVSFCGLIACGGGHGSLLAYDLVHDAVAWSVNYSFGVDQLAVTPDGSKIYMPHGADSSDGITSVIDASNGNVIGSINTGTNAHNVAASLDGTQVYVTGYDGSNSNYMHVVNPATNQVVLNAGPTLNGVRPFTVNGTHTLAFTTSSTTCGFQVLSLTNGSVLYTVPFSGSCSWSVSTAPSHGISLSPDEKRVYVMDAPLDQLEVYDVSGLPTSAPRFVASVQLGSLSGFSSPCQTYCEREGWVLNDLSGRYVYVGDTGNVISTSALNVVATLPVLQNTRQMIEADWTNGAISATSTRFGLGHVTTPSPSPTPSPSTPPGPVNKTWYFAEGRIGKGFREYLTIDNPNTTDCSVDIQYLYTPEGGSPATKTVTVPVPATSRFTKQLKDDLGLDYNSPTADDVSSIVSVSNGSSCPGVVVERPLYFVNYHGISSGNDVLGGTTLSKTYYFADIPTGANNTSYLSILNPPGGVDATVTVNYYVGGQQVATQSTPVSAGSRSTIAPGALKNPLPAHVAAVVTSNTPVMVERPTYFTNGKLGSSGGYDVVGAQAPANDWLFAEGYASDTGNLFQEYLTISNFDSRATQVTITLKSQTPTTASYTVPINANDQVIWDVNVHDNFSGATPEVSAEVTSTGANIVVQRELYFQYHHSIQGGTSLQARGGTDVMGMLGPITRSSYSFAEGYTNTGYHEWLTLQNPNMTTETITVTLVNGPGHSYTQNVSVLANSRKTLDITQMVEQNLASPGPNVSDQKGNEISMTVQTLNNGGTFVAERPEYWNTAGTGTNFLTQGGSDILGYIGG